MNTSRIRFVSGNFYQLQGLRLVPVGLLLLFLGADSWGWFTGCPESLRGPQALVTHGAFWHGLEHSSVQSPPSATIADDTALCSSSIERIVIVC